MNAHHISSTSNPIVRSTAKLRKSSERRKRGRFLIDGFREIELATQAGIKLDAIFHHEQDPLEDSFHPTIVYSVTSRVLEKLGYGARDDNPVAVAIQPERKLTDLLAGDWDTLLVLDQLEKPGNVGACFRTADAFGASVVLTDPVCEVFNPNTIRASRGTVFTVPFAISSAAELLEAAAARRLPVYVARVDASAELQKCRFGTSCAIVVGSEAHGLGEHWNRPESIPFRIPMLGAADSLNVSISTAVTLYERRRNSEAH